jgi:hypothetical protein
VGEVDDEVIAFVLWEGVDEGAGVLCAGVLCGWVSGGRVRLLWVAVC